MVMGEPISTPMRAGVVGAGGAAVDEHVLDLDHLLAVFGVHEVRRPRADDAGDALAVARCG